MRLPGKVPTASGRPLIPADADGSVLDLKRNSQDRLMGTLAEDVADIINPMTVELYCYICDDVSFYYHDVLH